MIKYDRDHKYLGEKIGYKKKGWEEIYQLIIYEMRLFDYLAYKTILYQIYKEEDLNNLQKIDPETNEDRFVLDARRYRAKRHQTFNKSYLNESLKIHKTIEAIKNLKIDILFFQ